MLAWLVDLIPWWIWAVIAAGALAASYPYWRPLWAVLPSPIKTAALVVLTGGLAYLAGRNSGSAGALQRAQEKEQARADDIHKKGAEARSRADHDAMSGGLLDDDGWRRDG